MRTFDVLILGAGQTGARIANQLLSQNLKIALVSLPNGSEDHLQKLVASISCHPERSEGSSPVAQNDNIVRIHAADFPHFLDEHRVSVNGEEFHFKNVVLATGCVSRAVAGVANPLTPVEFFGSAPSMGPVTVWGAGALGICAAMKAARAGRTVRLISKHERVLPSEDGAMSDFAAQQLRQAGIEILRASAGAPSAGDNVVCVGLKPVSDELNLKAAFVYADPQTGRVKTDQAMRTSHPRVFAVGAVTGPPFHLNFERFQADMVADNMSAAFFMKRRFMPEMFPSLIPFSVPLARIGDTEHDARAKFKDAEAVTRPTDDGFVKLIARKRSGLLAGAHVAGAGADGLILFFDLLMRAEITLRDVSERHHFPATPLGNAAAEAVETWIGLAGR
jgi:dihydrolipoamide dehydrogenase